MPRTPSVFINSESYRSHFTDLRTDIAFDLFIVLIASLIDYLLRFHPNISRIFAYLNNLTPKKRAEILELLVNGLKRLEYRGYDSAGVAVDAANSKDIAIIKKTGKVALLEEAIKNSE
ncbi:unnamed protein product [Acanthoscelides obtectus]|uniref:glutamine--fructose-6-phosphate transaminase (isomerizing) n=1 Tax=Acanthoscelides obtectus TaxID=200917 RepID=A0A9P0L0S9_ACAOB|nr:unnamed protein product [Acanthoscelides obtectus]CAK1676245.1 Glutamine--fructose-6-phosphate aminotransferase [isomerizing] 1 [Acanthoscelides obtectus]